jgi:hypothetical protein
MEALRPLSMRPTRPQRTLAAAYQLLIYLALLFDPEDGSSTFLRKVDKLLSDCTVSHHKAHNTLLSQTRENLKSHIDFSLIVIVLQQITCYTTSDVIALASVLNIATESTVYFKQYIQRSVSLEFHNSCRLV